VVGITEEVIYFRIKVNVRYKEEICTDIEQKEKWTEHL
jgi:hypothetical protein